MIVTDRLQVVPTTIALTRAALAGQSALAVCLRAAVPPSWPPELLDPPCLRFIIDRLEQGRAQAGWWLYFVILAMGNSARTLIGSVGYKGPPSDDGTVEVGYGIVHDHQRRGYATEAVRSLLGNAFALPVVHRVIAETLPELTPSIGVLNKCGFHLIGAGSEPGVIRFELTRANHETSGGPSPRPSRYTAPVESGGIH